MAQRTDVKIFSDKEKDIRKAGVSNCLLNSDLVQDLGHFSPACLGALGTR